MEDTDNDGLTAADPCPSDPRNLCFGLPALDPFTGRPLRINANASSTHECAGDKITCNGELWTEDVRYNEVNKASRCNLGGGGEACVITGITDLFGCEDETTEDIFQCEHSNGSAPPDLGWDFPIDDGSYLVNLYFANTFDGTAGVGDRTFDIIVEDVVRYPAFDQIAAAGASGHAVVRSVLVEVDDGNGLQLSLAPISQNPSIKGIEVLGSNAGTCTTTAACPPETNCNAGTGICDPSGNFQDELIVEGLHELTSLAFLPNGKMLVLQKKGEIFLVDPSTVPATMTLYLDLPNVEHRGEAGLLDITLDPDFETNNYFYLFYGHSSNSHHRISRFTHDVDHAHSGDEVMLWEDDQPYDNCCHYGGGLDFGPDGKLYMTLGEKYDPPRAQDMTLAAGKIIRINKDGSIPTDNPFYDGGGPNYDAMWALGLRNPFRARFDDPTGRLFMGDLGFNAIESVNIGVEGANYGWPICEGDCEEPGTYTDPIFKFQHIGGGHGIMGGIVYRGAQFPSPFSGAYFYGDYAANWIRYLTFDGSSTTVTGNYDFLSNIGDVVMVEQGPDGALYYVRHDGAVHRVSYSSGNQAPVITEASASPTSGSSPLTVNFTASGSDNEGDPLSYRWIFGDGAEASTASPQHTYSAPGSYTARLVLSDPSHDVLSDGIDISVGAAPTATITTPADGSTFNAGDLLSYAGTATDPVENLGPENFAWEVVVHHDGHLHPRQGPDPGNSGTFLTPSTGHPFGDNTHLEIKLTVTDSDGLSDTKSVFVYPNIVDVTFDTSPSGIGLAIDGIGVATPAVIDEAAGFQYAIGAPQTACIGNTAYSFDAWSDGGDRVHTITVGGSNESYIASYVSAGSCGGPDSDNDGLADADDPCPTEALNACFGRVATDNATGKDIRINANASSQHCAGDRTDCRGETWLADYGYNVGPKASACNLNGGGEACVIQGIGEIFGCTGDPTEDIFQCEHGDNPSAPELLYDFDVPNGLYLVNLLFANTFDGTSDPGDRVFDIHIEGNLIYDDFDQVVAAGGNAKAVVRSALIDLVDGDGLQIFFTHEGSDNPAVKGIEVLAGCETDAQCDDDRYCNGVESCGPDGACVPGTPVATEDGIDCTVDLCNEAARAVVHVPDDDRCSDFLFCNGVETCDTNSGCLPGTPPPTDDGVDCTLDACDESLDEVTHEPNHASCDDNRFCNGEETCVPGEGCVSGPGPSIDDGIACTTDFCDEASDSIQHIPTHSACNDGAFCNGLEICNPAVGCTPGVPVDRDDGVGCTVDFCNDAIDEIMHVPDDNLCDDSLFCNGQETCDPSAGCVAGTNPCSDQVVCTVDACDEGADACSHPPSDTACDDGNDCNGIETCHPTKGCQPGSGSNCRHLDSECTIGVCDDTMGGCSATPTNEGLPCDDGNACTMEDTCRDGVCNRLSFCGVPASHGSFPVVTDALFTMRSSVALAECSLCECDVNADGSITVQDALTILAKAVELEVELGCFVPISTAIVGPPQPTD